MDISPLQNQIIRSYSDNSHKPKSHAKKTTTKSTNPKDSVTISKKSLNKLDQIKARVASGFYSSNEVKNDITEKLSNVLNQMFD